MKHYAARQRRSDNRWCYTIAGDVGARPVGYCAGWQEELPDVTSRAEGLHQVFEDDRERRRPFKDKYHTDGHASGTEAIECYKGYLLDNRTRTWRSETDQRKCRECGGWTQLRIEVGTGICGTVFDLCEKHQDRDMLDKHFKFGGSMHSS